MSLFINKNANAAIPVKVKKQKEEALPIFDRYIEKTLAKLDRSISDARGRYELGYAYSDSKPSENWKVIRGELKGEKPTPESLENEKVAVWLKIGIRKQVIGENGEKILKPIDSGALVAIHEEMKDQIESLRTMDRNSEGARAYWDEAILAAKPSSRPKKGMEWTYNPGTDLYEQAEVENALKSVN